MKDLSDEENCLRADYSQIKHNRKDSNVYTIWFERSTVPFSNFTHGNVADIVALENKDDIAKLCLNDR